MATFSDGTDRSKVTAEFKPIRGRGGRQHSVYTGPWEPGIELYGNRDVRYGNCEQFYSEPERDRGKRGRGVRSRRGDGSRGGYGGRPYERAAAYHSMESDWRWNDPSGYRDPNKGRWREEPWGERDEFVGRNETGTGRESNWSNNRQRGRYMSEFNRSRGRQDEFPVEWSSDRIKGATVQTEELIQQILELSYECVVCCEIVEHPQSVWSCRECYQLFHLPCVAKWATAPNSLADYEHPEKGWKCPTCRHIHSQVPNRYVCFCGDVENPVWKKGELPHSCTEICGKSLNTDPKHSQCQHRCKQLCHPGPCPPCAAMVQVSCPCKKSSSEMRCNMALNVPPCDATCENKLVCGRHFCSQICHHGDCESCHFEIIQNCYCNKSKRTVLCCDLEKGQSIEEGEERQFSCSQPCSRQISCGNHLCERPCHEGECGGCNLAPDVITTCPCGTFPLQKLVAKEEERTSCLDPIPTCHSTCNKVLPCCHPGGHIPELPPLGDPKCHRCDIKCHLGECIVCEKQQLVQCECGKSRLLVPCINLKMGKPIKAPRCDKLCNKKMQCGRHRCSDKCCTRTSHPCNIICNKRMQCGHKCLEVCHTHRCPPCPNTSFDELHCYCGREVMYPPIPCGTQPPQCGEICTRRHPCGHPPRHNCHSEKNCPPCADLVDKLCMCGKEGLCNVPCHQKDPSCGRSCNKQLRCGIHSCSRICHRGICQSEKEVCTQKCHHARKLCGHACGAVCHGKTTCPQTLCIVWVTVRCHCGRKSSQLLCPLGSDNADIQKRIKEKGLAPIVTGILSGKKVDIGKFMELRNIGSLDCDEECQKEDWKRKLADAFGVDNSSPIDQAIREMYNPFLKEQAKLEPEFIGQLEEQMKKLIQSVQASQCKSQQHAFRAMRPNHRRIVHELASYYNCQTWSQDPEPQRQVVVLATKNSIVPSTSLTELTNPTKRLKKPL